jgi:predicted aldo/keto reductase-like oxidoreductase
VPAASVIRQAEEQEMGIILMHPLTSGVFQRLMAETWAAVPAAIEIDVLDVRRLLLNHVLSDPYVDVALVGMREPRFVARCQALAPEISDMVGMLFSRVQST